MIGIMTVNLSSKIGVVAGVGPKMEEKLNSLGVFCVADLFFNFPRRYLDFTCITRIADLSQNGEPFTIKGSISAIENKTTRRRGFTVTEAMVEDGSHSTTTQRVPLRGSGQAGTIKVVWFNQPFLAKMLQEGSSVILNGKVVYDRFSGGFVMESPIRTNRPQIIPVYSEVAGISSFFISKLVNSLKYLIADIEEWLPNNSTMQQCNNCGLLSIKEAILNIHFPANSEKLSMARRRFAFEELFLISLRADIARSESLKLKAKSIEIDQIKIDDFIQNLPFALTGDQQKAIDSILDDLQKATPMNRLLNGDVGSGKTVVAAVAALVTKLSGQRTCLMCPTTILATQHYETFKKFFGEDSIGIVTSSKKENISAPILIGTHALLNLADKLSDVGLVIVDEQHRFGVEQRARLNKIVCHSEAKAEESSEQSERAPQQIGARSFTNVQDDA